MNFYQLNRIFKESASNMGHKDFRDLLVERVSSGQHQIELDIRFDTEKKGIVEDRFARIRSITGVTIVSEPSDDRARDTERRSTIRVKFIPEASMRPVTYARTVLIPGINGKTVPGVHVVSIVPRSIKKI